MDDISNLFDDLNKVRDASGAIQGALGPKGVSINQSKSKYLIIGDKHKKQAGAELGQAQLKQRFGFTSVHLYQIDELEILLARWTPTTICH